MTIKVKQNLVSSSKHNIKCPHAMTAKYITVHNTANDASAASEIGYMTGNSNQVSYHFAIDDKEVVQGLPLNHNGWHCGDGGGVNSGNRTSIGVEICYSKSGGAKYKAAEALAIKFIAQLLKERSWGVDRLKQHHDWSGKNCPHRIRDEKRWGSFVNAIKAELGSTTTTSTPELSTTTSTVKTYTIKEIQQQLNKIGYKGANGKKLTEDGINGANTKHAVKEFQRLNGLTVDAIAGAKTQAVLFGSSAKKYSAKVSAPKPTLRKGSKGAEVKKLQTLLGVTADGIFGTKTETALKAWQKKHGLVADGVYGAKSEAKAKSL